MSVFREINMILSSTLDNPPPSELMIKLFCPVIKLGKDQGQSGYRDIGVTDQVYRCCDDSLIAIQQPTTDGFTIWNTSSLSSELGNRHVPKAEQF